MFKVHQVQNPTCALDLQARPLLHGHLWHATKGPLVIFHFPHTSLILKIIRKLHFVIPNSVLF